MVGIMLVFYAKSKKTPKTQHTLTKITKDWFQHPEKFIKILRKNPHSRSQKTIRRILTLSQVKPFRHCVSCLSCRNKTILKSTNDVNIWVSFSMNLIHFFNELGWRWIDSMFGQNREIRKHYHLKRWVSIFLEPFDKWSVYERLNGLKDISLVCLFPCGVVWDFYCDIDFLYWICQKENIIYAFYRLRIS